MALSTSVKFYTDTMLGAPALTTNNNPGNSLAIFKKCLVEGFNSQTPTSVTVASGIATFNYSVSHGYDPDVVIKVAGANTAALNGEKRIISRTAQSLTVDATGIADGTMSGSITTIVAPAGWEYVGTPTANTGMFRSADVTSTRMGVSIYDGVYSILPTAYEIPTGPGAGSGAFGGGCWGKTNNSSSFAGLPWTIISDGKTFYFHYQMYFASGAYINAGRVFCAGEFKSVAAGDTYNFLLNTFGPFGDTFLSDQSEGCVDQLANQASTYAARSWSGTGGAVALIHNIESYWGGTAGPAGATTNALVPSYPNTPNNALILCRRAIADPAGLRGYFRGLYLTPHNCHNSFNRGDRVIGQGDLAGRKLLAVKCGGNGQSVSRGVVFFDITGPWE